MAGEEERNFIGTNIECLSSLTHMLSPTLKHLNLHCNKLSSLLHLPRLQRLRELNLSSNLFVSVDLQELSYLPSLQILDLSGNRIDSLLPLPFLPSLSTLAVAFNNLESLTGLAENAPQLEIIDVRGNFLSRPSALKALTQLKLRELHLGGRQPNPICGNVRFLASLFDSCPFLESIDGRRGQEWKESAADEFDKENTELPSPQERKEHPPTPHFPPPSAPSFIAVSVVATPKFDEVARRFKNHLKKKENASASTTPLASPSASPQRERECDQASLLPAASSELEEESAGSTLMAEISFEKRENAVVSLAMKNKEAESRGNSPTKQHNNSSLCVSVQEQQEGGGESRSAAKSDAATQAEQSFQLESGQGEGTEVLLSESEAKNRQLDEALKIANETIASLKENAAQYGNAIVVLEESWGKRLQQEKQRSEALNRKIFSFEANNMSLRKAASEQQTRYEKLEVELRVAQDKCVILESTLLEVSASLKESKDKEESLVETNIELQNELLADKSKIGALTIKLGEKEEEIVRVVAEADRVHQEMAASIEQSDQRRQSLQDQFTATKKELQNAHENEIRELLARHVAELEIRAQSEQAMLDKKQHEWKHLVSVTEEMLQLEREKAVALQAQMKSASETHEKLERRFAQLNLAFEQALDEKANLVRQGSEYRRSIEQLGSCVRRLQVALEKKKKLAKQEEEAKSAEAAAASEDLATTTLTSNVETQTMIQQSSSSFSSPPPSPSPFAPVPFPSVSTSPVHQKQSVVSAASLQRQHQLETELASLAQKEHGLAINLKVKETIIADQSIQISELKAKLALTLKEKNMLEALTKNLEVDVEERDMVIVEMEEQLSKKKNVEKSMKQFFKALNEEDGREKEDEADEEDGEAD